MNQSGSSKTDTMVKLVLIFFISLLSFSVGTFVGKQFSDSQHRMASLENDHEDRNVASQEVPSNEALSDEDIANLTEDFVNAEKEPGTENEQETAGGDEATRSLASATPSTTTETTAAEPNTTTKTETKAEQPAAKAEPKHDAVSAAAHKVSQGESPVTPTKTNLTPKNELPETVAASTIGKYTIQVASFQSQTEAESRAKELKDQGFSAFVIKAFLKDKNQTWYRVSIGTFQYKKEADAYVKEVLKNPSIKSAIVQSIVR